MICKVCGCEIEDDSKFCSGCGSSVVNEDVATEETIEEFDSQTVENDILENDNQTETEQDVANIDNEIYQQPSNATAKKILVGGVIFAVIISIIALSISLVTYNSPQKKIQRAIDSKDAYEVVTLYNDAYGDDKTIEKYDETIYNLLDDVIDSLNEKIYMQSDVEENGYTIVNRDLRYDWGTLIVNDDGGTTIESIIDYYTQDKWDYLQTLIKSKQDYYSAIVYLNVYNEPDNAIQLFKTVIEDDSNYSSAQEYVVKCVEAYAETAIAEADELIKKDEVSDAASKLKSIQTYMEKNEVQSEEINNKVAETVAKYAKTYYDKSESEFKKSNVESAISNIELSILLQPDNEDYVAKKEYYEKFLPFDMCDKDNLEVSSWRKLKADSDVTSEDGKTFEKSVDFRYYDGANDETITYMLNGNYDVVTGAFFSPKGSVSMGRTGSCYFTVYGDGKQIYKSKTITASSKTQDVTFSVTGVNKLEIVFTGTGSSVWGVDAYSFGDYACIGNLKAQKNIPQ